MDVSGTSSTASRNRHTPERSTSARLPSRPSKVDTVIPRAKPAGRSTDRRPPHPQSTRGIRHRVRGRAGQALEMLAGAHGRSCAPSSETRPTCAAGSRFAERGLHRARAASRRLGRGGEREHRGPGAADAASERAAGERRLLDLGEPRDERGPAGLRVAVAQRPPDEVAVPDGKPVHQRGRVGHLLHPFRAAPGLGEHGARGPRLDPHPRRDQRDPPLAGKRDLHHVHGFRVAHEGQPAEHGGGDIVEVASRHRGLAGEGRPHQGDRRSVLVDRARGGKRSRDAAGRAAAHSPGEGEALVDDHPEAHVARPVAIQERAGGDGRGVEVGVARNLRRVAAGHRLDHVGPFVQLDGHGVADPVHGQAEHVEARPHVATLPGANTLAWRATMRPPSRWRRCRSAPRPR